MRLRCELSVSARLGRAELRTHEVGAARLDCGTSSHSWCCVRHRKAGEAGVGFGAACGPIVRNAYRSEPRDAERSPRTGYG